MKIETTRFGEITIKENEIIHMPSGIPGFPEQKQFVILEHKKDSPFLWYQSVDEPALAFVITNPLLFEPGYIVDIESILKDLSWNMNVKENQLSLYVIVKIPAGSPEKMTANLMGPILLDTIARQAVQIILPDSTYSHRHPLMEKGYKE